MPSVLFITAAHNNQIARLTIYQVIRENNGKLGYVLVRVTKRVCEVYFAQLYLTKVQIQVNKSVVFGDKMKVMDSRVPTQSATSIGTLLITERDRYHKDSILSCNLLVLNKVDHRFITVAGVFFLIFGDITNY
uniref:Uncharacterized protein n=1 Tax=Kalanchoe fedtschenkoi TaxID=63787 RepID=A0A7N0UU28_KALFE